MMQILGSHIVSNELGARGHPSRAPLSTWMSGDTHLF